MIERVIVDYDGIVAEVIKEGAHISLIRYTQDGVDFEVAVENEELEEIARVPLVRWEGIENDL